MKRKDFIDKVNSSKCYRLGAVEELFEEKLECVSTGLDLDEHRWYSTAINVYKFEDGYAGVFGAFQSFSEAQLWEDIGIECEAFPMKQVQTVTYEEESEQ